MIKSRHFSHWTIALGLWILLSGCQNPTATTPATETVADSTAITDNDSMAAIAAARMVRNSLPGHGVYQSRCASCHEGAVSRAPHREMLVLMTPEVILEALNNGVMQAEAASLSSTERAQVAEFLGGRDLQATTQAVTACNVSADEDAPTISYDSANYAKYPSWGFGAHNRRYIQAQDTGLTAQQANQLQPLWALAFPGANRVRSQPLLSGGLVFIGSHPGIVYALDQKSGCALWQFQASAEVRTGIIGGPDGALYFGDVLGNVYAIQASSGELLWKDRADAHPNATITGTPALHAGTLYVPVSALEVSNAIDPTYPCCTFRGSVVAYAAGSGERQWQSYTIVDAPTVLGKNAVGTDQWGPSGAVIWNSPSIDVKRNRLYVGTGENASSPATPTSDAIIAINLDDGSQEWVFQGTPQDAWNTACDTSTPENCPEENGPDFDFGAATMIVTTSTSRDLVIGGQKSGLVHALDADTGALVWQTRAGRGGIQGGVHFGMAADDKRIYVPITDMPDGRDYPDPEQPGIHALDIDTGARLWYSPAPTNTCKGRSFCHPGVSQSISVAGDMVLAGGMDGTLRIHASATGEVVHEIDTTAQFATPNGGSTQGGSFGGAAGPLLQDGLLVLSSGYGMYNHMPGNLLLVMQSPQTVD